MRRVRDLRRAARGLALVLLVLLAFAAPLFAAPARSAPAPALAQAQGQVPRGQSLFRPALGGPMAYSLYLPPGCATGEENYAVVYLLHGYGGNENDSLDAGGLAATADRLIAAAEIPPLIVVMSALGNSWYLDNPDPGGGAAKTAVTQDLRQHIEASYRAHRHREGRGLAGLSMGGYGAVRLALHRPDLYAAAASLSGAILPDLQPRQAFSAAQLWLFGPVFGVPFDAARFNASNMFQPLAGFANPADVLPIYLACGDDDYFDLHHGAIALFLALERIGANLELRITDGGHIWEVWARALPEALAFVGRHLNPAK